MRAHEILLEFNVEKTAEHYGKKLYEVIIMKAGSHYGWSNIGLDIFDDFWKYMKTTYGNDMPSDAEFDNLAIKFYAPRLISEIAKFDPTRGKYSLWIVKLCSSVSTMPDYEDMGRVHDALEQFHALKMSGYFARNKDKVQYADINIFKTHRELERFLDSVDIKDKVSNTQADKQLEAKFIAERDAIVVHDDSSLKIVIPKSLEASQYFGKNTRWCTAAKTNNMFHSYDERGDLYIILDKKNNRRWQLHFEERQFMDEGDNPIQDFNDGIFPLKAFDYIAFEEFPTDHLMAIASADPAYDDEDGAGLPDFVIARILKLLTRNQVARIITFAWDINRRGRYDAYIDFVFDTVKSYMRLKDHSETTSRIDFRHDFLEYIYFIWKNKEKFGLLWMASSNLKSLRARWYNDKIDRSHFLYFYEDGQYTFAIVNDTNHSLTDKFEIIAFYNNEYDSWYKNAYSYDELKVYYKHVENMSGGKKFNPKSMKHVMEYLLRYTDAPEEQ